MNKKNKRILIWISIVILFLIIVNIFIFFTIQKKKIIQNNYFEKEPEKWIDIQKNQDIIIDTNKATRNKGQFDSDKLELLYSGIRTTFFYHGFYKGKSFDRIYIPEELYSNLSRMSDGEAEKFAIENTLMKISPQIVPNDGIIDSYIIAKEENDEIVFYVFLDEDWKNQVEFTNILWTDDFSSENINVIPFDFTNSHEGIFINRIVGPNWFNENTNGGLYVGEIDLDVLKIRNINDLTQTFVYIT